MVRLCASVEWPIDFFLFRKKCPLALTELQNSSLRYFAGLATLLEFFFDFRF